MKSTLFSTIGSKTLKTLTKGGIGLLLLSCGLFPVNSAKASLVAALNPSSSGNMFIYDINFLNATDAGSSQPSERLDGCGTSCNGTNGNTSFATVYDLFGVTAASITLTGPSASMFTLTTQTTGITPSGVSPTDGPLLNFTVTYIGPATTTAFSDAAVVAVTSTSTARGFSFYTGQDTKNTGGAAGTVAANIGMVTVPVAGTPEPGSMLTLASGGILILAGMLRRRK